MIPVSPAPEPLGFDRLVRQRGLSAIDELVGREPRVPHPGRHRRKIAEREAGIPADAFPPYWRDVLDEMLARYERRCAYLALYIEHATGGATVDHVVPKSLVWSEVYEWSNYRLCSALINAKKSALTSLVDPFRITSGWFALELVGFQVVRGPRAPRRRVKQIEETLPMLNMLDCRKAREEYVTSYEQGHIDLAYLERRAPFVAAELRRQRRLRRGDR